MESSVVGYADIPKEAKYGLGRHAWLVGDEDTLAQLKVRSD